MSYSNIFGFNTILISMASPWKRKVPVSPIFIAGDKSFIDGEGVANSGGVLAANITINTLGSIYATDIKPLYVQNINNVNRSDTQTESFKLVIQI